MVLLRDVKSLHLLVHPGLLPGVALHDGEHDHVEGGVGAVQYFPPHIHTQKSHLFINVLQWEVSSENPGLYNYVT